MSEFKLRKLRLKRVSLVDSPANVGARVVLFKSEDGKEMKVCPVCGAAMETGKPCEKCSAKKAREDDMAETAKLEADLKAAEELATEEQTKRLAAEKRATTAEAEVARLKSDPAEVEKAALAALPESVRKRLEASETEIAKMRDERATSEAEVIVKGFDSLPVSVEKHAGLFRRAKSAMNAEDFAELSRVLASANEVVKAGSAFKEVGRGGAGGVGPAAGELYAKASELVSKGLAKTEGEAIGLVARENPALYQRYQSEARVRA